MVTMTEADLVVRAPHGQPIVVVEVKNPERLSPDVAVALRRNLVVHGASVHAPYFLLVSQEVGYLWDQIASPDADAPPTRVFPMDQVIKRYLPGLDRNARLRGSALELIVLQWLSDLVTGPSDPTDEPERTLGDAGLLDAIQDARASVAVAS